MDNRKSKGIRRHRVNHEIESTEVRLVNVEGENLGIVQISEALRVAAEGKLDLVEIGFVSDVSICRVMDFGKFRFDQQKKRQKSRKGQKRRQVKEIKFRPATGEMDYQTKLRKLREFLEHGDRIKVVLRFRGRELSHKELGVKVLERVRDDLLDMAKVEQPAKAEGNQMHMVMVPKVD